VYSPIQVVGKIEVAFLEPSFLSHSFLLLKLCCRRFCYSAHIFISFLLFFGAATLLCVEASSSPLRSIANLCWASEGPYCTAVFTPSPPHFSASSLCESPTVLGSGTISFPCHWVMKRFLLVPDFSVLFSFGPSLPDTKCRAAYGQGAKSRLADYSSKISRDPGLSL